MTKKTIFDTLFILIVATICHLLFSPYGFNPTDEGFVLSATNRVLHGQIPHVDFSSVRPMGYAYLHIPELLISKNYFFMISRFVFWLEQVLIAYLWIQFILKITRSEISIFNKYVFIIACFIYNVHYFPCSVLHTIDGLLMSLIGLNLLLSEKKWNFIGFIFIGFAALCKQNYLVVLPVTLFLFGRKNILLNFITGLLPIVIYVTLICIHGGWYDLCIQLSGHNELIKVGILSYLFNPFTYIGITCILLYSKLFKNKLILAFLTVLSAFILSTTNHYHGGYGFIFFGMLCGEIIARLLNKENMLLPFIALLLGWCVSISVGYNTPALFNGGIISLLLFYSLDISKSKCANKWVYIFILISVTSFYFVRTKNIYRDLPARNLPYKLDTLVEGATGIYTNKNTLLVLKELDSLKKSTPNLIVIPDFTACNILHSHESKILTEWPNKTEIPNDKILQKIISTIKNDSTVIFAIPVFQTALLKNGFSPQENNGLNYPVLKFIKDHYPAKEFTTYFELRYR